MLATHPFPVFPSPHSLLGQLSLPGASPCLPFLKAFTLESLRETYHNKQNKTKKEIVNAFLLLRDVNP